MYGLVNRAIEDLVCSRFGEETWETIKQKAGVDVDVFISMDSYPDCTTYRLVAAASETLGISQAQVLEAFGEYWVLYTAKEGYDELLKMSGKTIDQFILNLNNMHARVGLSFPELNPPSFWCTDIREDSMQLHYQSTRAGLAPMVVGLIKGLGIMFQTETEVLQTSHRADGADHDVFLIKYKAV